MIDDLLEMIAQDLEPALGEVDVRLGGLDDVDEVKSLEDDGGVLLVTLLHIERDGSNIHVSLGGEPPAHVNFYVLFSAHFPFEDYTASLKCISNTIGYFQGSPTCVFNGQDLKIELATIDFREFGNIWNALGAKHKPSILYKIRTLTIME